MESSIPPTPDEQIRWPEEIHAWQQSGLSQAAYCKSRHLAYHRFLYWRNKLAPKPGDKTKKSFKAPAFIPVHKIAEGTGLSVLLPNGVQIQGIQADNVAMVNALLATLV